MTSTVSPQKVLNSPQTNDARVKEDSRLIDAILRFIKNQILRIIVVSFILRLYSPFKKGRKKLII